MRLQDILARIAVVAGQPPHTIDRGSLLHAYSACLTFDDLCIAIALTLREATEVRLALRSRLLRLLGDDPTPQQRDRLVALVADSCALTDDYKGLRQTVDALHSAVIGHLPMPTQHLLLERWVDRGTRGAMARWLKATRDTPSLFDASVALAYWRAARDYRAAKSLAYQAAPETLAPIVGELVAHCEEGWIISKAILRSSCEDEDIWDLVRSYHPATYLYLCAQSRRDISDDEAFALVLASPGSATRGNRGLAIWAIGQMGKVAVLDRVRNSAEALFAKDVVEMRAGLAEMPAMDDVNASNLIAIDDGN